MEEKIVTDLFSPDLPAVDESKCIQMLRCGFDNLGICQVHGYIP